MILALQKSFRSLDKRKGEKAFFRFLVASRFSRYSRIAKLPLADRLSSLFEEEKKYPIFSFLLSEANTMDQDQQRFASASSSSSSYQRLLGRLEPDNSEERELLQVKVDKSFYGFFFST